MERATPAQAIASPVPSATSVGRRLWSWVTAAPDYPPDARDLRTVDVLGVGLPVRVSIALIVVTILVILDHSGRLLALFWDGNGTTPEMLRARAISRAVVLGGGALAVIVLLLRDSPCRYGFRLGDVRAGLVLGVTGCLLMTPIVVLVAQLADFHAYYLPAAQASPLDVVLTAAIEVIPAEFFFRGLLMFALIRVVGPIGILLATLPFAFGHLGKPELETLSTVIGGFAYGWLDWRTGSVRLERLAHVYVLSFAILLTGALTTG